MGVWDLFAEEKEGWIETVIGGVSSVTNLAIELPCALLALISSTLLMGWDLITTSLLMAWDYTCQGAQQVSDALGLEEWWGLEHTLWTLLIFQSLPIILKRAGGDKGKIVLQLLFMVQVISCYGALIFFLNGLQGGVIFEGKLSHPSMAFLALLVQAIMITITQMRLDMAGFGHDKDVTDERFITVYGMYETLIKYEAAMYFLIATFGLPKRDLEELQADPTSLLSLIPLIGLMYDWKKFEVCILYNF